jgi:hypothetical protein
MDEKIIEKILKDCWNASYDYHEQLYRINCGLSNFNIPTYPNKNQYIKNSMKKYKKIKRRLKLNKLKK